MIMIKIEFQFETQYGNFHDALYLPEDHTYTEEQIIEMQLTRLNNWTYAIENPTQNPLEEPKPETVEIDGVVYEKVEIDGQIVLKPVGV